MSDNKQPPTAEEIVYIVRATRSGQFVATTEEAVQLIEGFAALAANAAARKQIAESGEAINRIFAAVANHDAPLAPLDK